MIGLTGGTASGKSTAALRLRQLGAFVSDADEAARRVMDMPEVLDKVLAVFGAGVFNTDGSLNRRALAAEAFATADGTASLNAITHPAILKLLIEETERAEACGEYPLAFMDVPLLIESGLYRRCTSVWLVTADIETRIARIIARDAVTREEALARISRQMSDVDKALYADRIIKNDGDYEEFIREVDRAFRLELIRQSTSGGDYCEGD